MFSRSIRTAMLLVISIVVLAVQSALVVVVTRMGDEANLKASTHEMDLTSDTVSKSLGRFWNPTQHVRQWCFQAAETA